MAVGSGGVWKTVNRGTTWTPVFDGQGSYSIGAVTIDPNNHHVIWVGTGENVSGRHVGYGDGVYRSLDGGATWQNMGLQNSEHIGMIAIDPRDSNVVYVAAQGPLWSGGGDRGLYKTTDGGARWELILAGGEYTGVNEVHLDPRNPDVLFAVQHQRLRNVAALINGGPESGIFKSDDAGETWRELTEGLPEEDMGKIGLAISPSTPTSFTPRSNWGNGPAASGARKMAAKAGRNAATTCPAEPARITTRKSSPARTSSTASTRWTLRCTSARTVARRSSRRTMGTSTAIITP